MLGYSNQRWQECISSSNIDDISTELFSKFNLKIYLFNLGDEILFPSVTHHTDNGDKSDFSLFKANCLKSLSESAEICPGEEDKKYLFSNDSSMNNFFLIPFITSEGKKLGTLVAVKSGRKIKLMDRENVFHLLKSVSKIYADNLLQRIEITDLANELDFKYEELSLIYDISDNTQISDHIEKCIDYIINRSIDVLNPNLIVWAKTNGEENKIYENQKLKLQNLIMNKETINEICRRTHLIMNNTKDPLILNNLLKYKEFSNLSLGNINLLSIPLLSDTKNYGSLTLMEFDPSKVYLNEHLKLMESIARSTVNLLKNFDLYTKLQNLFFNVIRMLLGIIESKDGYTEGHSRRVYKISVQLGTLIGLSERDFFDLRWAAILHDLGKINIPINIIQKPGHLTDEEYGIIKTHPVIGSDLLASIDEFKNVIKGIRHHHERIDGKGYPDGLRGNEIPLISKIIGLADTFDALNSDRPYRQKMSLPEILKEIERSAGTQLDASLVSIFLKNYQICIETNKDESFGLFETSNLKGLL